MTIIAITIGWQMGTIAGLLMLCVGFGTWAIVASRSVSDADVDRRHDGMLGATKRSAQERKLKKAEVVQSQSGGAIASKFAVFGKPLSKENDYDRHGLSMKLSQAGIRRPSAVGMFLSAKMILMAFLAISAFVYGLSSDLESLNFFSLVTVAAVAGFFMPNIWLRIVVNQRTERITFALPDSLDMLVIAVEAGLSLDAAIQRVGDELGRTYPELAEEWIIASRETQMGIPRVEAMRKMAERTNVDAMHALVAIIAQAERLGSSIAKTLRVYAEFMRIKRRQQAEERAAKTTIKLLFPLIFFLFPTIFVVILGPAVINILKSGLFSS